MASSRTSTGITWSSGSSSVTVSSNAIVWSDAFTLNAEDWEVDVWVKADNQGTPASGDTCNVQIGYAADGTNFDTDEHAAFLFQLNTFGTDTPGEDPAMRTAPINTASPKFRIGVICANAATRNIIVTAGISAHRPQ